jgi:hypothetical protein
LTEDNAAVAKATQKPLGGRVAGIGDPPMTVLIVRRGRSSTDVISIDENSGGHRWQSDH